MLNTSPSNNSNLYAPAITVDCRESQDASILCESVSLIPHTFKNIYALTE